MVNVVGREKRGPNLPEQPSLDARSVQVERNGNCVYTRTDAICGLDDFGVPLVCTEFCVSLCEQPLVLFGVQSLKGLVCLVGGGHLATLPDLAERCLCIGVLSVLGRRHDATQDFLLSVGVHE